jgi:ADP-ribose pyrophosphatase YjhB (NUDIX family)
MSMVEETVPLKELRIHYYIIIIIQLIIMSASNVLSILCAAQDDRVNEFASAVQTTFDSEVTTVILSNEESQRRSETEQRAGPNLATSSNVIIFAYDPSAADVAVLRNKCPFAFMVVWDSGAAQDPNKRLCFFDIGVNMVTQDYREIFKVMRKAVLGAGKRGGTMHCPFCRMPGLTELELWHHCPAFHINSAVTRLQCPFLSCDFSLVEPIQRHIHKEHRPSSEGPEPVEGKPPLYSFSLVIVRHPVTNKLLLCQEYANQGFWLPGGHVDSGETFREAGIRETLEEAGVDIELKGILAIENSPHRRYTRQRVIFYAEPKDLEQLPKSIPDFESAGACWCSYEEILGGLRLRGSEPLQWVQYLMGGGAIHPLSLLHERE